MPPDTSDLSGQEMEIFFIGSLDSEHHAHMSEQQIAAIANLNARRPQVYMKTDQGMTKVLRETIEGWLAEAVLLLLNIPKNHPSKQAIANRFASTNVIFCRTWSNWGAFTSFKAKLHNAAALALTESKDVVMDPPDVACMVALKFIINVNGDADDKGKLRLFDLMNGWILARSTILIVRQHHDMHIIESPVSIHNSDDTLGKVRAILATTDNRFTDPDTQPADGQHQAGPDGASINRNRVGLSSSSSLEVMDRISRITSLSFVKPDRHADDVRVESITFTRAEVEDQHSELLRQLDKWFRLPHEELPAFARSVAEALTPDTVKVLTPELKIKLNSLHTKVRSFEKSCAPLLEGLDISTDEEEYIKPKRRIISTVNPYTTREDRIIEELWAMANCLPTTKKPELQLLTSQVNHLFEAGQMARRENNKLHAQVAECTAQGRLKDRQIEHLMDQLSSKDSLLAELHSSNQSANRRIDELKDALREATNNSADLGRRLQAARRR